MIHYAKRPIEIDEVRALEKGASPRFGDEVGCFVLIALLSVLGAVLVVAAAVQLFPASWTNAQAFRAMGSVFVVVLFFAAVGLLKLRRWERRESDQSHSKDLARSEVEIVTVEATACAKAPGESLLLDVGDGKILFIVADIFRAPGAERLPTSSFTVVRLPRTQRVLRVECRGEPIPAPWAPSEEEDGLFVDFERIPDMTVFEGRLATVKHDVARLLASGNHGQGGST
jgi:hypothetical protein